MRVSCLDWVFVLNMLMLYWTDADLNLFFNCFIETVPLVPICFWKWYHSTLTIPLQDQMDVRQWTMTQTFISDWFELYWFTLMLSSDLTGRGRSCLFLKITVERLISREEYIRTTDKPSNHQKKRDLLSAVDWVLIFTVQSTAKCISERHQITQQKCDYCLLLIEF